VTQALGELLLLDHLGGTDEQALLGDLEQSEQALLDRHQVITSR
jgi:hypothetical protein